MINREYFFTAIIVFEMGEEVEEFGTTSLRSWLPNPTDLLHGSIDGLHEYHEEKGA